MEQEKFKIEPDTFFLNCQQKSLFRIKVVKNTLENMK